MYEFENGDMEYMGAMMVEQGPCLRMNDPGEIPIDEEDEAFFELANTTDDYIVDEQGVNDDGDTDDLATATEEI